MFIFGARAKTYILNPSKNAALFSNIFQIEKVCKQSAQGGKMTLKIRHHVLVCLEEKNYSRRVLLRGASLARRYGYTFEVIFFCSMESEYTMFHLLNLAEGKKLSEELGAVRFIVKRVKDERDTARELVDTAKNNNVKEIIMSGAQSKSRLRTSLWRRIFFCDKYNYILNHLPDIILVLINHHQYNPFEKGKYRNGKQAFLVKKSNHPIAYFLRDRPFRATDTSGLFFQKKDTDERTGIFAFIRRGRVRYVYIYHGKTDDSEDALQLKHALQ